MSLTKEESNQEYHEVYMCHQQSGLQPAVAGNLTESSGSGGRALQSVARPSPGTKQLLFRASVVLSRRVARCSVRSESVREQLGEGD